MLEQATGAHRGESHKTCEQMIILTINIVKMI
jgi:hypothetical protein